MLRRAERAFLTFAAFVPFVFGRLFSSDLAHVGRFVRSCRRLSFNSSDEIRKVVWPRLVGVSLDGDDDDDDAGDQGAKLAEAAAAAAAPWTASPLTSSSAHSRHSSSRGASPKSLHDDNANDDARLQQSRKGCSSSRRCPCPS